jgi:hypothetical protein
MILIISGLAIGQEYKTGIGIRAGFSSGVTIKYFESRKAAFEGLLTTRSCLVYEILSLVAPARNLFRYY